MPEKTNNNTDISLRSSMTKKAVFVTLMDHNPLNNTLKKLVKEVLEKRYNSVAATFFSVPIFTAASVFISSPSPNLHQHLHHRRHHSFLKHSAIFAILLHQTDRLYSRHLLHLLLQIHRPPYQSIKHIRH